MKPLYSLFMNEDKAVAKRNCFIYWYCNIASKILQFLLLPTYLFITQKKKHEENQKRIVEWNEARAKEILDYWVPQRSNWDSKKKVYRLYLNGSLSWSAESNKEYLAKKDYKFWDYNWKKILDYLVNTYEADGFTKIVLSHGIVSANIEFCLNENENGQEFSQPKFVRLNQSNNYLRRRHSFFIIPVIKNSYLTFSIQCGILKLPNERKAMRDGYDCYKRKKFSSVRQW